MRLLRIAVNCIGILTMPLWVLPWVVFIATTGDSELNKVLRGEIFFWVNL